MQRRWLLLIVLVAYAGCGRGTVPSGGDNLPNMKRRELAILPEVGDYSPPLDDGRLEAAPPAGWNVMQRGKTYLIGFAKGKASELPRIVLNAEELPAGSPAELTEEKVAEFAASQDRGLRAAAKAGKKKIAEYNLPIVLGETPFVRHVRQAQLGDTPCVIQSLQTIRSGRLYTIELIAEIDAARSEEYDRSLTRWRDDAYAVAAHLKFAPPGEKFDPLATTRTEAEPSKSK
jgi:hypothetical protein